MSKNSTARTRRFPATSAPADRAASRRLRIGVMGGSGVVTAVAAALLITGAGGAAASKGASPAPASMVVEGSGASDSTTPTTSGVHVIDGDMLIAPTGL